MSRRLRPDQNARNRLVRTGDVGKAQAHERPLRHENSGQTEGGQAEASRAHAGRIHKT